MGPADSLIWSASLPPAGDDAIDLNAERCIRALTELTKCGRKHAEEAIRYMRAIKASRPPQGTWNREQYATFILLAEGIVRVLERKASDIYRLLELGFENPIPEGVLLDESQPV